MAQNSLVHLEPPNRAGAMTWVHGLIIMMFFSGIMIFCLITANQYVILKKLNLTGAGFAVVPILIGMRSKPADTASLNQFSNAEDKRDTTSG